VQLQVGIQVTTIDRKNVREQLAEILEEEIGREKKLRIS
jgi:hypothetical protein